ncbi:MAG: universal stress protein [Brumimicrobium sp.]|nr:universal stress protein [Brumimicrobium sp.]
MSNKTNLLVPIDFTEVTENAFTFALDIAKDHHTSIILLHIVSYPTDRLEAEQKLKNLINKHVKDNEVEVDFRVVIGKVLTDIGIIADSIGVDLIIMGTHSTSIWQKIFGSPAMSVVSNSSVPFVLIQKKTDFSKINTIVMTLDMAVETTQVVRHAARFAKIFHSKLYLVARNYTDELLRKNIHVNLIIVNDYLQKNNLEMEIKLLDDKDFEKALVDFCKEVNANLLAATYYKETFQMFSSNIVQELAENNLGIPVLTYNGEDSSIPSNFGFITT